MYKDYYDLLGLGLNASLKDIKQAYRRLARQFHPEINANEDTGDKFLKISQAYNILSNPIEHSDYDSVPSHLFYTERTSKLNTDRILDMSLIEHNLNNLLSTEISYFNNILQGYMNRGSEVDSTLSRTRKSLEYTVEITLEESFTGIIKTLPINYGVNGVRLNLTVNIPRGIDNGSKIFLNTGDILIPEDIYVVVRIKSHRYFIRDGQDLHGKVSIDLVDSILGTEIKVPTINGNVLLKIPPGTKNGIVFRLSGKGMPILGSNNHKSGNLYLAININYPKHLSTEEKNLLLTLKYMQNNKTG